MMDDSSNLATATFGGGCFWCVEAVYVELKGVIRVVSGYAGGHVKDPTYREVTTGTTGHAEVAQITYDPSVISYKQLLEVFWNTHDPTTLNRQGNDVGPQYRSIILYHDEVQKSLAEKSKKEVATGIWDDPIVTEIVPLEKFYIAENYHQDYFANHPGQPYCRVIINPKVQKFRKKFSTLLKESR
jgi:peptide-methionine (S)-S-oxide reductase